MILEVRCYKIEKDEDLSINVADINGEKFMIEINGKCIAVIQKSLLTFDIKIFRKELLKKDEGTINVIQMAKFISKAMV